MGDLVDLKNRDYAALSFSWRADQADSDFYSLLDYLMAHTGIAIDDLHEETQIWYRCGFPVDAFDEIAYIVSQRDIGVPDWWFEQLALIRPWIRTFISAEGDLGEFLAVRVWIIYG